MSASAMWRNAANAPVSRHWQLATAILNRSGWPAGSVLVRPGGLVHSPTLNR